MASKREQQLQRVEDFLKVLDRLKESGIIFSSVILKRDIIKIVRDLFSGKPLLTLDESLGIKEEIDGIIFTSLRNGTPLFISASIQEVPVALRRLEQILKDGYIIEVSARGQNKLSPANGWYSIMWADSAILKDQEFPIRELLGYKLML